MATLRNFQMKNIKKTRGIEGEGCTGTMYLNGKKVGTYADYADGALGNVEYISKEAEEEMTKLIITYAKDHPCEYVVNLYNERPQQYKEKCERFKKYHPYIPDEDITKETMSVNDICFIVEDFLKLYRAEKIYKRNLKQGYKALVVCADGGTISYPSDWSEEKVRESFKEENKEGEFFFELSDFEK